MVQYQQGNTGGTVAIAAGEVLLKYTIEKELTEVQKEQTHNTIKILQ